MPGQHGQVGAQRPDSRVVPVRVAPQLDEHILHNVLGGLIVPQDAQRAAVHAAAQGIEDVSQGVVIPSRQARRQHGIRTPHPSDANPARGTRQ